MNDTTPLPRLGDYGRHALTYWRRLTVLAILGALVGGALFFSTPQRYFATSRVAVSPQIVYLSLSQSPEKQPQVTLDTTAALVRSDYSIGRIAEAMGVGEEEARESLVISAKPLSRVLILQVRADSKVQARAGVNAATEALIYLQAESFALSNRRVRLLRNRVATINRQALDSLADGLPSGGLFATVNVLEQKLERAITTNNTSSQVIMRALVVGYRPGQIEVFVVSGLTIGMALALLTAGRAKRTSAPRRRYALVS
ncbi:MAG: hypothetical protein WAW88_09800 [Nocardioides sp.]